MTKFKEMLKKWRAAFKAMLKAAASKPGSWVKAAKALLKSLLKRIMNIFRKKTDETAEEKPVEQKVSIKEKAARKYLKVVKTVKSKVNAVIGKIVNKCAVYVTAWEELIEYVPEAAITVWALVRRNIIDSLIGIFAVVGIKVFINEIISKVFAKTLTESIDVDENEFSKAMRDDEYKAAYSEFTDEATVDANAYSKIPSKIRTVLSKLDKFASYIQYGLGAVVAVTCKFAFGIDTRPSVMYGLYTSVGINICARLAQCVIKGIACVRMNKKLVALKDKIVNGINDACERVDAAAKARLEARAAELKAQKMGKKAKA